MQNHFLTYVAVGSAEARVTDANVAARLRDAVALVTHVRSAVVDGYK